MVTVFRKVPPKFRRSIIYRSVVIDQSAISSIKLCRKFEMERKPGEERQGSPKKSMERTDEVHPTKKVRRTESHPNQFFDLVLAKKYVDKTMFIEKLEEVFEKTQRRTIVCFRPRRFGKSLTLAMMKNYYDVKTVNEKTFQDLYIGKKPTKNAHQFLVLSFNFSGIDTTSFEGFEADFNDKLNSQMETFKIYYKDELIDLPIEINEKNAADTFQKLVATVSRTGQNLYVLVDEYDASINEALGNVELVKSLQSDPKSSRESEQKTKKIETKFKQFFSRLKEASQEYGVFIFVTGVTPLALTEFTSGFNDARDITLGRNFAEMYGFTEDEVKGQLNFIPHELNLVDDIATALREKHNGYRFSMIEYITLEVEGKEERWGIQVPSVYNPGRIRHSLQQVAEKMEYLINEFGLQKMKTMKKSNLVRTLFHFPEDHTTNSAEYTRQHPSWN
jgi:hypothetical protein